ncbi:MAG: hypothetical protein EB043_02900 [Actinobacteria bacterium]|nr:hypothetical protein [Actinomycetota bacterium]
MKLSIPAKVVLWSFMLFGFAFIYVPLTLVVINSFNKNTSFAWPPTGFTTQWWQKAAVNEGVRDAIFRSLSTAFVATAIALLLGSLAAAAISRYEFFGRDVISLLFVLPIALPGIVTGIALNNVFTNFFGKLTFFTIIVTTFTAGAGQTTLPIWIFQNLFRPNQAPIVNVVAAALILISILPIYLSQRLTQERN